MQPTTILVYSNGHPGADPDRPDALLTFLSPRLARQFARLAKQHRHLRPLELGTSGLRELVEKTPTIPLISVVTGLGPLQDAGEGKRSRVAIRFYMSRAQFLAPCEDNTSSPDDEDTTGN